MSQSIGGRHSCGARLALVIASETGGLTGCENDAEVMGSLLRARGFEVVRIGGTGATRSGIIGAYEDLIREARQGDAVVVFYSGHGGLLSGEQNGSEELRFILPTDIDDSTDDDFRGVLAEEFSLLQWRLTLRTANVTSIFDCCFSGRISRDWTQAGMRFRGRKGDWSEKGILERKAASTESFRRLRASHPESEWFDANPHAVRVLACSQGQLAQERHSRRFGQTHGLLTAALVAELTDAPDTTWREAMDRVRHGVLNINPTQRPEVEGDLDRVVFTENAKPVSPTYPVSLDLLTGQASIDGAFLHELEAGDELVLLPAERGTGHEPVRAKVGTVSGTSAYLVIEGGATAVGAMTARRAHPKRSRQVVRVHSRVVKAPVDLVDALSEICEVDVAESGLGNEIVTVTVTDGRYSLEDAAGNPLSSAGRPLDVSGIGRLRQEVTHLVTAARLRDLSLTPDGDDLAVPVELITSIVGDASRALSGANSVMHVGDRIRLRVCNRGTERTPLYANVLDLGVGGRVTVLNTTEPSGIELFGGAERSIGAQPDGHEPGLPLTWPRGLPVDSARFETLLAVFSDRPQDLRGLVQDGVGSRQRPASASEELARLLRSDRRDLSLVYPLPVRFAIRNLTFLLCPGGGPCIH